MSITLTGITKRFQGFTALDGVTLEARDREFLALLGPSGSGKTTLLRIMAGLEFADSGQVAFEGEDVSTKPIAERRVGFVFQQYALFRHMTVADNIAFGLRVRKRRDRPSKAAIAARVQELLDLVQLGSLGARYPAQLSGGQRQRVALARALAVEPRLLLLDEPFGALDAKVRKDLRRWLRELHDRVGLTSVFVTHDQEEALELADRVVVMDHGRIDQVATPDEIYRVPATPFVFDFVGEANRLPVDVADGAVRFGGRPVGLLAGERGEGPAELFFRPHDVQLAAAGDEGVAATVTAVRARGGQLRLEAAVAGQGKVLELDTPAGGDHPVGSAISVLVTSGRLFDR
jgi:sulfate/thiosulfate transport system ATP-binding protein